MRAAGRGTEPTSKVRRSTDHVHSNNCTSNPAGEPHEIAAPWSPSSSRWQSSARTPAGTPAPAGHGHPCLHAVAGSEGLGLGPREDTSRRRPRRNLGYQTSLRPASRLTRGPWRYSARCRAARCQRTAPTRGSGSGWVRSAGLGGSEGIRAHSAPCHPKPLPRRHCPAPPQFPPSAGRQCQTFYAAASILFFLSCWSAHLALDANDDSRQRLAQPQKRARAGAAAEPIDRPEDQAPVLGRTDMG